MEEGRQREPQGSHNKEMDPLPYRSNEGRYGMSPDVTRDVAKRLTGTDWSRLLIIFGAFAVAMTFAIIFGLVVTDLPPETAMPWVFAAFTAVWATVGVPATFYFRSHQSFRPPPAAPDDAA